MTTFTSLVSSAQLKLAKPVPSQRPKIKVKYAPQRISGKGGKSVVLEVFFSGRGQGFSDLKLCSPIFRLPVAPLCELVPLLPGPVVVSTRGKSSGASASASAAEVGRTVMASLVKDRPGLGGGTEVARTIHGGF